MKLGSFVPWDSLEVRLEEISSCQESRSMVSREFFPKNKALAEAILWRLCIIFSMLSVIVMASVRFVLLWSGPVRSGPVWSSPVRSGPVRSGPVRSGPVRAGPVRSGLVRSVLVWSGLV